MLRNFVIATSLLVAVAVPATGQVQEPHEKVLLPLSVTIVPLPGAHGSLWQIELIARNNADVPVEILLQVPSPCVINFCPPVPAHSTSRPLFNTNQPNGGIFLYIGKPGSDGRVALRLRVQDVSRQSLTHGTEIPIVRERDTFRRKLVLLDVPINTRFRNTLRAYDFLEPGRRDEPAEVFVRIYATDSSTVLVESKFRFTEPEVSPFSSHLFIGDLASAFPALVGTESVRVEIESATPPDPTGVLPDFRFWAFVSTTNNETQHVTIVTPSNRE